MNKCTYCGDEKATKEILSPNMDSEEWNVCDSCNEVIEAQKRISFASILLNLKINEKYAQKIINEANNKLDKIAKITKKPIMTCCLTRNKNSKYEFSSITFTG